MCRRSDWRRRAAVSLSARPMATPTCIWSLINDAAIASFADPGAVPVPGMSPLPNPVANEGACAEACSVDARCRAYTYARQPLADHARGSCWLVGDISGSAGIKLDGYSSGLCSRGSRGTCCLRGEPLCSLCDRGQSPTSFCHHAEWSCTACGLAGIGQSSASSLQYCPPLPPPPSPSPALARSPPAILQSPQDSEGICCHDTSASCEDCLGRSRSVLPKAGFCDTVEMCTLCDPQARFCPRYSTLTEPTNLGRYVTCVLTSPGPHAIIAW